MRETTGQMDWSGGVDSNRVPTIAGTGNPNGLRPNQLAWANNLTMRGGGLTPRGGWVRRAVMPVQAWWQEAYMYEPDEGHPYIICMIGGHVYRIRVDTDYAITDLSEVFGQFMPATEELAFMEQGEQFLVIQSGDYTTLPLFWEGATLRRSNGPMNSFGVVAVQFVVPAVGAMVDVTLTAPFTGTLGDTVLINGKTYTTVDSQNVVTLKHNSSDAGFIYPAGTQIFNGGGTEVLAITTAPFTAPAPLGTVQIPIDRPYPSTIGSVAIIKRQSPLTQTNWEVTAVDIAPPAANHVFLSNLTDTPGATVLVGEPITSIPELPAAGPMNYYMGRMWLAAGREYIAGDIVGGPSGTAQYARRDSILRMVENTYLSLGGTFRVPTNAGNIRALKHPSNLDTSLGEGQLLVFTRESIYSVNVVPTRAEWQSLEEPIQRVVQHNFGTTSDRSVVSVNGDLFYQSVNGVNSLVQAIRYFNEWGNRSISVEEARAINRNNRELLRFGSGIEFGNRLYQTALPERSPVGVIHKALLPLNFDLISTLSETLPPAWEGANESLDILRVIQGDFGGRQRAFIFCRSRITGDIELWEMTDQLFDHNATDEARITWALETPSFTWDKPFTLKQLQTMELWVDKIYGRAEFLVEFRPDQHPCWEYWFKWFICSPRNECDLVDLVSACSYPVQTYKQGYMSQMLLPAPPTLCQIPNARPINFGFGFQIRVTIKGYCRLRGLLVHAEERISAPYERIVCDDLGPSNAPLPMITI